jgi:Zn finger protein HypA/HybF involved in hydrogenase expression
MTTDRKKTRIDRSIVDMIANASAIAVSSAQVEAVLDALWATVAEGAELRIDELPECVACVHGGHIVHSDEFDADAGWCRNCIDDQRIAFDESRAEDRRDARMAGGA